MRTARLTSFGLVSLLLALAPAAAADPILDPLGTTQPRYQGAPATAQQLAYTKAPRNPFMAPNPRSNIHNDTWMTDAYRGPGPLGRNPTAFSSAMPPGAVRVAHVPLARASW